MKLLKPGWVAQDDHPIFSIDIHPAGGRFATGGQGDECGRVTVWNLAPIINPKLQKDSNVPKMLCQMDNHLACVNSVRWSGTGKYLASAGDDQRIILWTKSAYGGGAVFGGGGKVNVESYRAAHTLRIHEGDVLDIAWSPGDVWLASASVDNTVVIWDVEKLPSTVAILRGHTGHVKGVTWDPVGKYLATQSADKTLRVWRTSDWAEEANIKEPFEECGGTTHVLRLDWSPDGQYLVSAHAMNGGGPTAQILEREGWKTEKDFVGHRKAVTCVRFNENLFEMNQLMDGKQKNAQYVCIAIGSRDRSLSVWLTKLKRPLFVIHDVFESSILDLAWSKDGMVLLACSMDGSVAAVVLTEEELGTPMSQEKKDGTLKKVYGGAIGQIASTKPLLVENPELLRLTQNGAVNDVDMETEECEKQLKTTGTPIKGPLDKQIEMKTSDGRRRITPIFILPNSEAVVGAAGPAAGLTNGNSMSCESVAKYQMLSSSSEAKSKIRIEKVAGVVEPNVSPGKKSSQEATRPLGQPDPAAPAAAPAPRPNMIEIKRKPGPVTSANPAIGAGSAARAPAAAAGQVTSSDPPGSVTNTDSSDSQPQVKKVKKAKDKDKNKKKNRIESDSSSSDSSESDSSNTSSDDETASQTSGAEAAEKPKKVLQNGTASAAPQVSRPIIVTNKRKAEDAPSSVQPPVKKRGRPPGSGTLTPVAARPAAPVAAPPPAAPAPVPAPAPAGPPCPGLPPLALTNNRQNLHFCQLKVDSALLNIFVHNNLTKTAHGSLHRVLATKTAEPSSQLLWDLMLPSPVTAALSTHTHLLLACRDATVHLLDRTGARALPPFSLPAPLHRVQVSDRLLAAVTTGARLFVWRLQPLPAIVIKNEEIGPLQRGGRQGGGIVKISFSKEDQPVLSLSDGSVHSYSPDLGCWLLLVAARTAVTNVKLVQPAAFAAAGRPLALLAAGSAGLALKLEEPTEDSNTASAIEAKLSASLFLGSAAEYRYWLAALVKRLARAGREPRLRALLDSLLGPVGGGQDGTVLGISKVALLKEVLPHVASNIALQRLYSEYNNQLKGSTDLFE